MAPIGFPDPSTSPSREGCPKRDGRVWWDSETGEVRPWRCRRNGCTWCGAINGKLVVGALSLARPERLVTLTQVGDKWQVVRARMKQLVYEIRREGVTLQLAWAVERNPRGTGHHVHGVQYGGFVKQATLAAIADGVGMGRVADIRRLSSGSRGARYPLKALAGTAYTLKGAREAKEHIMRNGGRLVHASRGFWRDAAGEPLPGLRKAVQAALRASYGEIAGSWILVREKDLGRAAVERVRSAC